MKPTKHTILTTNPNPNLGELLVLFQEEKTDENQSQPPITDLISELRQSIEELSIPKGVLNVVDQLRQEVGYKNYHIAQDKIKNGLKRIKLLKNHSHIQQQLELISKNIEKAAEQQYQVTPHEKALSLLSELIYKNKSIYTPLSEIKTELSPEIFTLYVAFETIGCINGDGWAFGIFGNNPQLVPYISETLEILGYAKVAKAVRDTIAVFPKGTNFLFDNQDYIDVLNFIENPRRKVDNDKLNQFTKEERQIYCTNYINALNAIETVEDEIWNGNEWQAVYDYYDKNLEQNIWRTIN